MPKEIPILFNGEMRIAVMEDRKTVTRRIMSPQPSSSATEVVPSTQWVGKDFSARFPYLCPINHIPINYECTDTYKCPYGKEGDLIWVRETHYRYGKWMKNGQTPTGRQKYRFVSTRDETLFDKPERMLCDATNSNKSEGVEGWYKRLPRYMPKIAARIWLEVSGVRVEKLHDISPTEAGNEGIECINIDLRSEPGAMHADYKNYMWRDDPEYVDFNFPYYANPVLSFYSLWEKINGKESLDTNPWVWVIEFMLLSTTGRPVEGMIEILESEYNLLKEKIEGKN